MTLSEQDLLDAILRSDFESFLRRCLLTLNPGMPFLPNWHIKAITYQLERVRRGEVNRLIINMPPRHLKSLTVSVAFPAFLLGLEPWHRIFAISYGSELSLKHARDFRAVVTSPWYGRTFTKMRIARDTEDGVYTSLKGFRQATSVGGSLTGMGGKLFIIDDPLKPLDAQSEPARSRVNQWIFNTLMSRLDNKQTGVIIVVMQRVHMDDLSGFLASSSAEWEILSLPAIAEVDERIQIGDNEFHSRQAGEALHFEHEPLESLLQMQRNIGSYFFGAQYQQSPIPEGGAMLQKPWFRFYETVPECNPGAKIFQSWDVAAKDGLQNDYSVCTTWRLQDKNYYLLDLVRGRFDFPRLRDAAMALSDRYQPYAILIEDASAGISLAQELRAMGQFRVKSVPVDRDKQTRLFVQAAKFEAGRVHFPKAARFLPDLLAELLAFPNGRHDDQVDSISQALAYEFSGYTLDNVRG